jgi:hypothetical protein
MRTKLLFCCLVSAFLILSIFNFNLFAGDMCEEAVERMIECTEDSNQRAQMEQNREALIIRCRMDGSTKALAEKCSGIGDCGEYMSCMTGR